MLAALALACACGWAAGWPGTARAAPPGSAIINDCNTHNALTRRYTIRQLQDALNNIPADIRAYSACYQLIQRQLLLQEGKKQGGGGDGAPVSASSGGSSLPTALIVVIVVLLLAAAVFGAVAIRRRRAAGSG